MPQISAESRDTPSSRIKEMESTGAGDRVHAVTSSGYSHGVSTQRRVTSAHNLARLRVDKYSSAYGTGAGSQLSPKSEADVANRISELSQLETPLLRELAKRLGDYFFINTPRYVPKKTKRHPYSHHTIGERWQEIQGNNNWKGLLDPIDPVLRAEIVRYGEFAQACYDAFDGDTTSRYCGSSKFTQDALLEKVGLENRGYEITDFIYSTSGIPLPDFFSKSHDPDPWSKDSNWMGFVAVCTSVEEIARLGRRDIVIAWRGTTVFAEWIENIRDFMQPAGFDPRNDQVMVESGFLSVYKSSNERSRYNKMSARQQVLKAVKNLLQIYHEDNLSITVTGHSLGSALATLCAYDIAETGMNMKVSTPKIPSDWYDKQEHKARELILWGTNGELEDSQSKSFRSSMLETFKKLLDGGETSGPVDGVILKFPKFSPARIPITVYSFAGPRVGNKQFCARIEDLGVAVLRVVNATDLVTSVPGGGIWSKTLELVHEVVKATPSYQHVGVELRVDNRTSPYLKETGSPVDTHNLEQYLHLVDGYQGSDRPFQKTQRDIALVNKRADLLKPEYYIPPKWWQEENKGLIRDEDGHWILPERDAALFPPTPDFQSALENASIQDVDLQRFVSSVSRACTFIVVQRGTISPATGSGY